MDGIEPCGEPVVLDKLWRLGVWLRLCRRLICICCWRLAEVEDIDKGRIRPRSPVSLRLPLSLVGEETRPSCSLVKRRVRSLSFRSKAACSSALFSSSSALRCSSSSSELSPSDEACVILDEAGVRGWCEGSRYCCLQYARPREVSRRPSRSGVDVSGHVWSWRGHLF